MTANLRFGRDMQTLVVSMVIANFGARIHERFFPLYLRDLGASIFYGYQSMILGLCAALGPLAGGVAYQNFGYCTILLGDAVLLIIRGMTRRRRRDDMKRPGAVNHAGPS